jgi:hypothetical protein
MWWYYATSGQIKMFLLMLHNRNTQLTHLPHESRRVLILYHALLLYAFNRRPRRSGNFGSACFNLSRTTLHITSTVLTHNILNFLHTNTQLEWRTYYTSMVKRIYGAKYTGTYYRTTNVGGQRQNTEYRTQINT